MRRSAKVRFLNFFRGVFRLPTLEVWLTRLTRGKPPDHLFCKLVPNPYQYHKPAVRSLLKDGIHLSVDISDYIGHYYYYGFHDPAEQKLFSLCGEAYNVLDIGSNIGYTLLRFASKATKGYVIGFEPDPFNFSHCSNNLSLNNFDNARALNMALGSAEGRMNLEIRSPDNLAGNRIVPGGGEGVPVEVRKLDAIFPELQMNHLDLVKIDVEGYELKVLKGGAQTLTKFKPVLFIEIDANNLLDQGDSAESLIDFLSTLGYSSFVNAENDQSVGSGYDFSDCHFDIIAK